jgi:antitoxin CptB
MAAETTEIRRKRLRFRAWHRGTREMDHLFGGFADRHLSALDGAQLDRFERLLENSDPELYAWLTGREPIPLEHDDDVMALLRAHIRRPQDPL